MVLLDTDYDREGKYSMRLKCKLKTIQKDGNIVKAFENYIRQKNISSVLVVAWIFKQLLCSSRLDYPLNVTNSDEFVRNIKQTNIKMILEDYHQSEIDPMKFRTNFLNIVYNELKSLDIIQTERHNSKYNFQVVSFHPRIGPNDKVQMFISLSRIINLKK